MAANRRSIIRKPADGKRTSIPWDDLIMAPVNWILGLGDYVLNPLQKLIGQRRMAYFFVLPNLLIFGTFVLLPMLLNFVYGFTSGESILLEKRTFVGTQNLERLFDCETIFNYKTCREDMFWRGASNTAVFVTAQVGAMIFFSLITALALNYKIPGQGFFRSVFFYPVLLSPVVVALIWKWILQEQNGLLNAFLVALGGEKIGFLTNSAWATFWVIFISVWAQMGFFTLILLAGLQAIPGSLYEAASMDGANAWRRFTNITMPLLMPNMVVVLVLALIRAVQVFDQVYVLTSGGPGTATLYVVQYIFRTAFEQRQFGLAAAASLLLAVVLLVLTFSQLYFQRRVEEV